MGYVFGFTISISGIVIMAITVIALTDMKDATIKKMDYKTHFTFLALSIVALVFFIVLTLFLFGQLLMSAPAQ